MQKHHADMIEMYGGVLPFRLRILTERVYGDANDNKEEWISHYRAHNELVQTTIPREQLLVFNMTADGWSELCSFLQRKDGPCASQNQTFPHENTIKERRKNMIPKELAVPNSEDAGSKFAYASVLANPTQKNRRDYFMSFLVAAESIRQTGSTHDIVAMIYGSISDDDLDLLRSEDIKVRLHIIDYQYHASLLPRLSVLAVLVPLFPTTQKPSMHSPLLSIEPRSAFCSLFSTRW